MTNAEDRLISLGFGIGFAVTTLLMIVAVSIVHAGMTPKQQRMYNCIYNDGNVEACEAAVGQETGLSQCVKAGGNLNACWVAVD